jgi:murein L,D-transpeptidase YcbB/YkuD
MERKVLFLFLVLSVSVIFVTGCATMGRQTKAEIQTLKDQVVTLETQLQQKDAEIDSLRKALSQTTEKKYAVMKGTRLKAEVTTKPTTKQIQTALKNAGYDPGPIDGRIGKSTQAAIKDFQKANSLIADGKVGKQTWSVLVQYLNKNEK